MRCKHPALGSFVCCVQHTNDAQQHQHSSKDDIDHTHLRIETLMGTAIPPPPQLLHLVQPDLLHELQPTSPSDHLVQKHGCNPEPPQLGHGRLSEASNRSCSAGKQQLEVQLTYRQSLAATERDAGPLHHCCATRTTISSSAG